MYRINNLTYSPEYVNTITTLLKKAGFLVHENNGNIFVDTLSYEDEELIEKLIDFNII